MKNSSFEKNKAGSNGSAIYAGSISLIENSTFNENNAAIGGGAIYIANPDSITTIKDTTFIGCDDNKPNKGGAIYTEGKIDLIENSTFNYNYGVTGGAIYIANQDSITTINGSSFYGNGFNSKKGGAIYTEGKIDNIAESSFDINNAVVGGAIYTSSIDLIDNTIFDGNGASSEKGGSIYIVNDSHLLITDSTFDENYGCEGAGIYTHGGVTVLNSNLTKNVGDNSSFVTKGGSIYANGDIYLDNVNMANNFAKEGGSVYSNGTVSIRNSNNIADNGVYMNNVASNGGNVVNLIFSKNYYFLFY